MFKLRLEDIHLRASSTNKPQAIRDIAAALTKAGYAEEGYVEGMLAREKQSSTYLGNGIAIPHGTPETRRFVKQTGVQVFQFPEGIEWGEDGQLAYVAIGISAQSDEHLTLLRQLTRALSEDGVDKKIAAVTTAEALRAILQGENSNGELFFNGSLIAKGLSCDSLVMLQAVNVGNLQKIQAIDANFIAETMSQPPVYLGHGIWLNDAHRGNLLSAIAVSKPINPILEQEKPVKMLITAAIANDAANPVLSNLAALLSANSVDELLSADADGIIALLNPGEESQEGLNAEFVVINPHGLHTRPSSLLVKVIKEFNSSVTVANLDGTGKPVNGTSLMKVVALGAKKGHRLRFTAVGDDAELALSAIGKAMSSGLGEESAE